MNIEEIRARNIEAMRDRVQTTDQYWDRDCRCCMELMRHKPAEKSPLVWSMFDLYMLRTGRKDYHIKGAGHKVLIAAGSEEIHADHTNEEISLWQSAFHNRGR